MANSNEAIRSDFELFRKQSTEQLECLKSDIFASIRNIIPSERQRGTCQTKQDGVKNTQPSLSQLIEERLLAYEATLKRRFNDFHAQLAKASSNVENEVEAAAPIAGIAPTNSTGPGGGSPRREEFLPLGSGYAGGQAGPLLPVDLGVELLSQGDPSTTTETPGEATKPASSVELASGTSQSISSSRISSIQPESSATSPSELAELLQPHLSKEVEEVTTAPTLQCSWEELCSHRKPSFDQACIEAKNRKYGYARLEIDGLPPLIVDEAQIRQPGKDHFVYGSYDTDGNFTRIRDDRHNREKIHFPKLPLPESEKNWTWKELEDTIEQILKNPPNRSVPYIIGEPLFEYEGLSAGEKLSRRGGGDIPGVNTQFMYWNLSGGPTLATFHREDVKLCSINVNLSGYPKCLLTIRPEYNDQFESVMRQTFKAEGCWDCDNFIRHYSRVVHLSQLKTWGIGYDVTPLRPGQGFFTLPGTYHGVVNLGNNLAIAINYEANSSPDMPENFRWCNGQCPGSHHITEAHWRLLANKGRNPLPGNLQEGVTKRGTKRAHCEEKAARPTPGSTFGSQLAKRPRGESAAIKKLRETKTEIQRVDKLCGIPSFDENRPPSPDMFKLAAGVHSRIAIRQFCSVVRASRSPDSDRSRFALRADTDRSHGDIDTRIIRRLQDLSNHPNEKLRVRLNELYLAEDIESSKQGRLRADTAIMERAREILGWHNDKFREIIKHGRNWKRIGDSYEGILCFIFLSREVGFGVSPKEYRDMRTDNVPIFRKLVDNSYVKSICRAGKAFQDSLDGDDIEFGWESGDVAPDQLPEEEMLRLLQPFPSVPENRYDPGKYPQWPRPVAWPKSWPWPADPTWIPDTERQCDSCDETACDCIDKMFLGLKPRIKRYNAKGLGLQAVSREAGQVAYKKGDLIGQLTGDTAPLATYCDKWTIELVRSDMSEETAVCQIHCGQIGNLFRLLNHSCQPVARFTEMRASGKWIMAIRATGDIYDGTEITVSYGEKPPDCRCVACEERWHGP